MSEPIPLTGAPEAAEPADGPFAGLLRQAVEFMVVLCVSVLIFRTFAAEAYIVPTGSMAPTLLGTHRELLCPNCGFRFVMGLDEEGRVARALCPNCGQGGFDRLPVVESNGDRVLVQKYLYDVRPPRRWEVAVFHFPGEPSQAYVKRVVGLPGESVRILGGDIYANGKIARKTLKEQHAIRVQVYDHNYLPGDSGRFPRWSFRRGRGRGGFSLPTGWKAEGSRFVHEPTTPADDRVDWVDYRHWDPERARYTSVHDFIGYNGPDVRAENAVPDLVVEARVAPGADVRSVFVRLESGSDMFLIELPVSADGKALPVVTRNRRKVTIANPRALLKPVAPGEPGPLIEASVMDHRLTVALDGVLLFDPIDYDDPAPGPGPSESPVGIGVTGGKAVVSDLKVFRDVYYTGSLAYSPRRPFGVDQAFRLGANEFFVLGDNSPVSNDSRFWADSPVVPGELFLGKPFLVHLPGQAVPFQVFGRSFYWVPDPREIRYIR